MSETESRELAEMPRMEQMPQMSMIEKLVDRGQVPDIATLERLIDLQNAERARQAKEDFDQHFAAMQSELEPVVKDGTAKKGNEELYDFATLGVIMTMSHPIITKHGFSYSWDEEAILEGKEKRVWCIVTGYGHSKKTYVDIPIQAATGFANVVQKRGEATTYGKRYSFINAFGIIIADRDNDAATFEDGRKYANQLDLIEGANSLEELKANTAIAWKALANDQKGKKILTQAHDKRKAELSK